MPSTVPKNLTDPFSWIIHQNDVIAFATYENHCSCCSSECIYVLTKNINSKYGIDAYVYNANLICENLTEHTVRCNCFIFTYDNVIPVLMDEEDCNGVIDALNNIIDNNNYLCRKDDDKIYLLDCAKKLKKE